MTAFRRAKIVFCYVALPHEVQTWRLIEGMLAKGKRVVVPVAHPSTRRLQCCEIGDPNTELAPGAYGVWEPLRALRRPVRADAIDLALVPGVAFDRLGRRLGHGLGYFDRWLSRLPKDTPTVGLAYACQLFDRLPVSAHDRAVTAVLTA